MSRLEKHNERLFCTTSWSKKYYSGLTEEQHKANDVWFHSRLDLLRDTGILAVPNIQKFFNKRGEVVKNHYSTIPHGSLQYLESEGYLLWK